MVCKDSKADTEKLDNKVEDEKSETVIEVEVEDEDQYPIPIAVALLNDTLRKGGSVSIPSLGVVIRRKR